MPTFLLDGRFWGVLIFCALEAAAGWTLHHKGYVAGQAEVQAAFDEYKLQLTTDAMKESTKRQAKETAMLATNQKVTADYVSLQAATGTAVRALDADRMRLQAIIATGHRSPGANPGAGLPPDDGAQVGVLAACIDRYAEVAGDADQLSDQVRALQEYVERVVPNP